MLKPFSLIRFATVILCVLSMSVLYGQAIETEYGKNRVQFHDDFKYWSKYETPHFITYWYGKGRNIGQLAAQMAEYDHHEIRKIIEHKINDKIEILVYVDVSDVKQSNLGTEDAFVSKSGETKIVGNKMFVYFDGNHHHLRRQIREGIASVYFNAMMFGANFQEIIQNAVLLDVPEWFSLGIVSYAGKSWNIFIEDELRDILYRDPKYYSFDKLAEDHPRVAGHALWYYISQNYGKSAISNLLYLTRISRKVDNAFEFVLNTPLDEIYHECERYYKQYFEVEKDVFKLLSSEDRLRLSNKPYAPVSHVALSPNGKYLAYAHNNQGIVKIRLFDIDKGLEKKILRSGFKNNFQETDYNYPHICWNDDGSEFSYLFESRDKKYLYRHNVETGETIEQKLPEVFQRVYHMDYFDDRYYVFSASTNGLSDIYLYDVKMRQEIKITDDLYDDLDVHIGRWNGEKGIFFASNRLDDHILPKGLDTILPVDNFDLFFYPIESYKDKYQLQSLPKLLERLTFTPDQNERFPIKFGENNLVYLNDKHGVINSFVVQENKEVHYPINNFGRNIIRHSVSQQGHNYVVMLYNNGAYEVHLNSGDFLEPSQAYTTELKKKLTHQESIEEEVEDKDEYDEGMKFVSRFEDKEPLEELREDRFSGQLPFLSYPIISPDDHEPGVIHKFNRHRILAAGLRFKLANVTTRLDNDVLFGGLEIFTGENDQVNQVPMGILAKATVDDLFEDYRFEGGVRFPTSFNGSEYFLVFDNDKYLIDKRFALYRRSLTENSNSEVIPFSKSKKETILGLYRWKYPFDIYNSISATSSLRFDRFYYKSTNEASLAAPVERDKRVGLRLEYIFDNSLAFKTNITHGSKIKFFVEAQNQFEMDLIDGFDFEASEGFTTVIGYDARHYIPLLRESVIALRAVGATSIGSKRNIYYLGDVNNTFLPTYNQSIPVPGDNFAFKSNVNHLRGFRSNIRNGTSFLLWNAELRIPLFRYMLAKNKGAAFFRDFHLVGFVDAGLAWHGSGPFDDKNALNTVTVQDPITLIEAQYFRDPLVVGYGWGVRTNILGYFVKLDYGIGIETRKTQSPRWHLSFGYDF